MGYAKVLGITIGATAGGLAFNGSVLMVSLAITAFAALATGTALLHIVRRVRRSA